MGAPEPHHEVYAIRYATNAARTARQNFMLYTDPHDRGMPMDFFLWAIRRGDRTIVVDTGFNATGGGRRQRYHSTPPGEGLRQIGVDPASVTDVVLTHLHFDHAGNFGLFPAATFHLQDSEMAFATGRCMCYPPFRHAMDVEEAVEAVRHVYAGRVRFHDGDGAIADGVTVHRVGGHSAGLQVVRVATRRGWIVLASDAAHYCASIRERRPFPIVVDVAEMMAGYETCEALADGPDHIIPGHDPEVLVRFPKVDGLPHVARLDLPPVS